VNKQKTPQDVIYRLKIPNTNRYTINSEEMAKIAKTYHEDLQTKDTPLHTEHEKHEAQKWAMAKIPNEQKITNPLDRMNETLKEEHILEVLLSSKSRSAAGIDSIPYDIWKLLHNKHQEAMKMRKQALTS
jgi:hypothetical protein